MLNQEGYATVTGRTTSLNYPLANPVQSQNAGGWDGYITTFSSHGVSIENRETLLPNCPGMSVSPNPFYDILNIEFTTGQPGEYFLSIYDTSGRRISSSGYYSNRFERHLVQWYPGELPCGLYFAEVQDPSGVSVTAGILYLGSR